MSTQNKTGTQVTDAWSELSRCDPDDPDDLIGTLTDELGRLGELEDDRILDDYFDIDAAVAAFRRESPEGGIKALRFDCRHHTYRVTHDGVLEVKTRRSSA